MPLAYAWPWEPGPKMRAWGLRLPAPRILGAGLPRNPSAPEDPGGQALEIVEDSRGGIAAKPRGPSAWCRWQALVPRGPAAKPQEARGASSTILSGAAENPLRA